MAEFTPSMEDKKNTMTGQPARRKAASGTAAWKLAILLLLASLFSLSALAKYSFAMPRSSPSHWICKTCKIHEHRSAVAQGSTVLRVLDIVVRCDELRPVAIARRESDQPRA